MPCAPRVSEKKSPAFSAFTSANVSKILALELDLVLTFSDLQAEIVATLIREGVQVHAFNQRTVAGILDMVRMVGGIVGKQEAAEQLAQQLAASFEKAKAEARNRPRRPRVYFEEWDGPMISGIGWVSEIVEAAGGIDVFANLAREKSAKNRIVSTAQVIEAAPDIIIGSWCGKRFRPERLCLREGFDSIPAVRSRALHEVKSNIILQPGADRRP